MVKIQFGFANEKDPPGSWEGIGIKPGLLLVDADYYGAISYLDEDYVVAKVVEDEFNNYPECLGKFIVRSAVRRTYSDGSGILLLNQEENDQSRDLESLLNSEGIKERITSNEDIKGLNSDIKDASFSTGDLILSNQIIATSIIPEEFNKEVEKNKNSRTI